MKTRFRQKSLVDCVQDLNRNIELNFKPYQGKEKFIFVSYAHVDIFESYIIMKKINERNFNQWYDEGIPISLDWRDIIATRIVDCFIFMPILSNQYLASENCKKEIKYMTRKNKNIIYPIYLEEVDFNKYEGGKGIEMYISDKQALLKYKLDKNIFYEKLLSNLEELMNG